MFVYMKAKKFHGVIVFAILLSAIFLFSYFRLKPVVLQTVGYTYDQGRDFLKASEIVLNKDPTFIGPTTGIMGIYHGAWWYYILAIGFFLFQGLPSGFYYLIFIIQFFTFIIFLLFSRKYFDTLTQLILALIIATSPYLIFNTVFIANNVMAMPPFLFLMISTVLLLEKKLKITVNKKNYLLPLFFLSGLFLGLTSEFEFAFGLLLIPTYIITLLVFNRWTKSFSKLKHYILFFVGLGTAFAPRFLFEIKNNFSQSKTLISYVINPEYRTPKPFQSILDDRLFTFHEYIRGIFINDFIKTFVLLVVLLFLGFLIYNRKKISISFLFLTTIAALLFIVSLFYKDTFWNYYYDGIQYLFLLIIGYVLSTRLKKLEYIQTSLKIVILGMLLYFSVIKLTEDIRAKPVFDGIQVQQAVVDYIHKTEPDKKDYCVRIYTPPIFPYTYNYLFLYSKMKQNIPVPSHDWKNDRCWYIVEYDDYIQRIQKWRSEHIPTNAKRESSKRFRDARVELWTR